MHEFAHTPVLYRQTLAALQPAAGQLYVDGTLGGAGHAEGILELSSPTGRLIGIDRDMAALENAAIRLKRFEGRLELRHGNFAGIEQWMEPGSCDGVLLDLGVSSPQLDHAERGFSLLKDGPLDMRMDRTQGLTAAELVNRAPAEELARIFWEFGGEREGRRFARAIEHDRVQKLFESTTDLAGLIARLSPRLGRRTHPATKVFQALRIAVNDELGSLRRGLDGCLRVLKQGGALAVITFHSAEDRIVKNFGRVHSRGYTVEGAVDVPELRRPCPPQLEVLTRKAIHADEEEMASNPRSRTAQLRVMRKVAA